MDRRRFLWMAGVNTGAVMAGAVPLFASLRCSLRLGREQCESAMQQAVALVEARHPSEAWCWAACIEMAFRYRGYTMTQERIAREMFLAGADGAGVNASAPRVAGSTANIGAVRRNLNRRGWNDDAGKKFASVADMRTTKAAPAARDLDQDSIVIVGLWAGVNAAAASHPAVLTSLVFERTDDDNGRVVSAEVNDPWPGIGKRVLARQEWESLSFVMRIRLTEPLGEPLPEKSKVTRKGHWEVVPCTHWMHPEGDKVACVHTCGTYQKVPIICHAYDIVTCTHPIHGRGDEVWVAETTE